MADFGKKLKVEMHFGKKHKFSNREQQHHYVHASKHWKAMTNAANNPEKLTQHIDEIKLQLGQESTLNDVIRYQQKVRDCYDFSLFRATPD